MHSLNQSKRDHHPSNPLLLFRDIKFYFLLIAHSAFLLRLGNFTAIQTSIWNTLQLHMLLGLVQDGLNGLHCKRILLILFRWMLIWTKSLEFWGELKLQSIKLTIIWKIYFSFVSIGMNFAVGAVVDFCRNRFATIERPAKGSVIGFCLRQGSNWPIIFFDNFWRPVLESLLKLRLLYKSTCYPFNSYGDPKYENCIRLSCFACYWERSRPNMGTMRYVFISVGQFRFSLWLYAIGLDTYLVSLFRFSKTFITCEF